MDFMTPLPLFTQGFARHPHEAAAPAWAFDRLAWLVAPCLGVQGSTLFDLGPRKQHATITGAAWKPSPHGWSLDFSGGNHYAEADWIGQGGLPITMMCLFKVPDITSDHDVVFLGNPTSGSAWLGLRALGGSAGDPVAAFNHNYGTGSTGRADTTDGYSADTWHVGAGVFVGQSERHSYIDGGGKGTNDNTIGGTITANSRVAIGANRDDTPNYGDAQIALAAVWERALNDVEVQTLSRDMLSLIRLP